MKMNIVIKSLAIFMAAAVAMRACADTVDVSVHVKDQDGRPVEDVKLGSESGDKSISGEGGKAKLAVKKRGFPEILVGYVRMSINFQATRDPVCDGSEILEAAVAARAAASQLEQSVYGLNRR